MSEKIFIFETTFIIDRFISKNASHRRHINAVSKYCNKKILKFLNHHRFIIRNSKNYRHIHILRNDSRNKKLI